MIKLPDPITISLRYPTMGQVRKTAKGHNQDES